MLTRDLLRFRVQDGKVVPGLLRPTPALAQVAEELIAAYRQAVGGRRRELEEQLVLVVNRSRSALAARGLSRVLEGLCAFREPSSCLELRERAFAASMRLLAQPAPAQLMEDHRTMVARELGLEEPALREGLYADLPDAEVLESAPQLSAAELIARYNLALCQGLLLSAQRLTLTLRLDDPGPRRRLLGALRFHRLLALVRQEPGGALVLEVSGPASVLDSAQRYGLQLALFLPAICAEAAWRLAAELSFPGRIGREATGGRLELSDADRLPGANRRLGFVPEEVRGVAEALAERLSGWTVGEAPLHTLPSGEVVVADVLLRSASGTGVHALELFHRWHAGALARRLDQLEQGLLPGLIIGVERALLRSPAGQALAQHPAFLRQGFAFTEMPTARAVQALLERLHGG